MVSNETRVRQSITVAILTVFYIFRMQGEYVGCCVSTIYLKTSYSKESYPCARRDPFISVGCRVHGITGPDRTLAIIKGRTTALHFLSVSPLHLSKRVDYYKIAYGNCQSLQDCYAKPQCCGQTVQHQNQSSVKGRPSAEQHHGTGRITVTALILLHIIISTMTGTVRSARHHSHCTAAGATPSLLL